MAEKTSLPFWTADVKPLAGFDRWADDRLPVWSISIGLTPWSGPEVLETRVNNSVHCGKGRALVVGADAGLSCGEVELVRRLEDAGWTAARWVQAFVCGR